MRHKVKTGAIYRFFPVFFDRANPPAARDVSEGEEVRVVKLYGCPPPNTMGMCHIESRDENGNWKFAGMVCCNSLVRRKAE